MSNSLANDKRWNKCSLALQSSFLHFLQDEIIKNLSFNTQCVHSPNMPRYRGFCRKRFVCKTVEISSFAKLVFLESDIFPVRGPWQVHLGYFPDTWEIDCPSNVRTAWCCFLSVKPFRLILLPKSLYNRFLFSHPISAAQEAWQFSLIPWERIFPVYVFSMNTFTRICGRAVYLRIRPDFYDRVW